MARIVVALILLCTAVPLVFFMQKYRDKPDSTFTKSLFQISSVRFFPVRSLVYTFFAIVILSSCLLVADKASNYEQYVQEDREIAGMGLEKFARLWPEYEYPLVAMKGTLPSIHKEARNILVIGDSFVWGHGTSNMNQVWWGILSSELERRGYDCNVYAVGFPGVSTCEELYWMTNTPMLEDIQPDLIILGYYVDDANLTQLGMEIKVAIPAVFANEGAGSLDFLKPLRSIFPSLYYFLDSKALDKFSHTENHFYNSEYGYNFGTWLRKLTESPYLDDYNTQVIQPMGSFIEEINIPMIVVPTPAMPTAECPLWDICTFQGDRVMPLFEQAGLPVYDSLSLYREYCSGGKNYEYSVVSPVNLHCGPASSWFYGNYVADVLEQNYATILGEKSDRDKPNHSIEINDWLPFMLRPQAIQESEIVSQYTIVYPDQFSDRVPGYFLTLPLRQKYVKLNFKYPVRLSSIQIEGEDLLSAEIHTLAINHRLGFDDQKPVSLGKRRGAQCEWTDKSKRDVTSLLVSAKTVDGKQASLTITTEGEVVF